MNINKKHKIIIWTTLYYLVTITASTDTEDLDAALALLNIFDQNAQFFDDNNDDSSKLLSEYDFIIVGAGSAGCVLANRLSEISDWKILIIEAGGEENIIMDIPLYAEYLQLTSANWNYTTVPSDKYCSGFVNKQCLWPRGKVLGGSSVLNYMSYSRGSKEDYDDWEVMGNTGWGWDNVLPYFKRIEHFNIPSQFDSEYHAKNGHLHVEYSPFQTELSKQWVNAAQELGFNYSDYNGANPSGVSFFQLSMKNGSRHSSNRAYLNPVKNRPNLHKITNALVTRLILDNTTVLGVELEKYNQYYTIYARKEVIVSAGAINSPQLLMLSGIGPTDILQPLNISVVKDLPVGKNLMDHIGLGGFYFEVDSPILSSENISYLDEVDKWINNRNNSLSIAGGTEALVFMNTGDKFNITLRPDIELILDSTVPSSVEQPIFGFTDYTMDETFGLLTNSFAIDVALLQPKSRGEITLQSKNPKVYPLIEPNYLEHEEDMQILLKGIRTAIEISEQPSMVKMGAKLYSVPVKQCLEEGDFGSDAYYECQTRLFTFTVYHHCGTCKMGNESDITAVVNPRLIVHGFTNLRVIDASIMPKIVSAHLNVPTTMIAEKGADLIKEDWGVNFNSF